MPPQRDKPRSSDKPLTVFGLQSLIRGRPMTVPGEAMVMARVLGATGDWLVPVVRVEWLDGRLVLRLSNDHSLQEDPDA